MTVLLIEDSRFMRRAIELTLLKAGHKVLGVSDGEEGLRVAHESVPDLILLDMMLPKVTGQDVLMKLKADSVTSQIPVVVLTGLSQKNEDWLVKAGAVGYIEKADSMLKNDGCSTLLAAIEKFCPAGISKKELALNAPA